MEYNLLYFVNELENCKKRKNILILVVIIVNIYGKYFVLRPKLRLHDVDYGIEFKGLDRFFFKESIKVLRKLKEWLSQNVYRLSLPLVGKSLVNLKKWLKINVLLCFLSYNINVTHDAL